MAKSYQNFLKILQSTSGHGATVPPHTLLFYHYNKDSVCWHRLARYLPQVGRFLRRFHTVPDGSAHYKNSLDASCLPQVEAVPETVPDGSTRFKWRPMQFEDWSPRPMKTTNKIAESKQILKFRLPSRPRSCQLN